MKAIITSSVPYPRSGAASNYIQYFAAMLDSIGYDVTVLSVRNEEILHGLRSYQNIKVKNVVPQKPDLLRRILNKFFYRRLLRARLNRYKLSPADLVVDYSYDLRTYETVLALRQKQAFSFACCPTEWFPKEEFDGDYSQYVYLIEQIRPQCDIIFPISEKIEGLYQGKGCKTFRIPIMCDSREFSFVPKRDDKYRIILPANGKMKDALPEMLTAVSEILAENVDAFEFHLTGVSEALVKQIIGADCYEKIRSAITIHPWMQYEALVALYQDMHYLLLARGDNQMTQSNFPSKLPECMCYGIVPMMSNVGDAPRFYLQNAVNSFIFEGDSVEACKEVIRNALSLDWNEYQKMSESARKTAEERFDFRNWSEEVAKALREL